MQNIFDLIIIGSGPAGATAAIYAARKGLKVLLLGKEIGGNLVNIIKVDNFIGLPGVSGFDFSQSIKKQIEAYPEITQNLGTVKEIKKNKKTFLVSSNSNQTFESRAVIIATGRSPRHLNVPGEKEYAGKGVAYCDICDAPLFKNKITAVAGSGNSGLETALTLAKICPKVYVLELADKIAGDMIFQKELKALNNVEFILSAKITAISGNQFVSGLKYLDLKTKAEKSLAIDGIFVQAGWVPATDFERLTKKNKQNEIKIDKANATSVQGIFAAGDCTDSGFYQLIIAAGAGAKAALSANKYLNP